jgi:RNA polymerase-binding transcription factor DksA
VSDVPEQLDLALDPAADLGALEAIEADLDAVEAALRRLDDGSYGTCEACGTPLSGLDEDPLVRRCPDHLSWDGRLL